MIAERTDLKAYLARLRELPFVRSAEFRPESEHTNTRSDGSLRLTTPHGDYELLLELKRSHLTYAIANQFLATQKSSVWHKETRNWILAAPYVPRQLGRELASRGANYIDLEGNCHLRLGESYLALIEGRIPPRKSPEGRGLRAEGHQVQFVILAQPELLSEGIVKIAEQAGTGKTTVANSLGKMEAEGILSVVGNKRRLINARLLLDRWLTGYANVVRPRLLLGRYRTQDPDPMALEHRIQDVLGTNVVWAWGGGAAAMRLTRHYRGEETVLHLLHRAPDFHTRLHALRDDNGPLVCLGAPGPVAFAGAVPNTVHPLLVYTELMTTGDDRAREAALEVREQYLAHLA